MTIDRPSLGRGNVVIRLGDEEHILKPTMYAAKTLSRKYRGLNPLIDELVRLNIDAIQDVIEAGLGRAANTNVKERERLGELIWETGFTDDTGKLGELCINYVINLMRGGRPLTEKEQQEYQDQLEKGNVEGNPQKPNDSSTTT